MAERSNDRVTESSNDFYEDIVTERKEWVNPPKELRFNYQLLFGKEGRSADQYFAIFPNGIIVTGVALFHPLIQIGLQFLEGNPDGQINIHLEDERFWNVADRGQKSKIPKFKDHALCTVEIQNQSFEINHAIDTSLVNFNSRLKAEPNLILQKYGWEGHIAVLFAKNRIIERMKRRLITIEEYANLHEISTYELGL